MRPKLPTRATLAGLALALVAVGCAPDQLTAPQQTASAVQPSGSLLGGLLGGVVGVVGGVVGGVVNVVGSLLVPAVQRSTTLSQDIVAQQTIDARGGSISLPGAGMRITFAPGAVSAPTAVTVTAHAGNYLAYSFEPHGIQFAAPVIITQDLADANASNFGSLMGGYMPNGLTDLDQSTGNVNISEQYPTATTYGRGVDGRYGYMSTFQIHHFSGYILTGGRR